MFMWYQVFLSNIDTNKWLCDFKKLILFNNNYSFVDRWFQVINNNS